MIKLLFLIHDLAHGGAEKVLVNLVNNLDPEQFDITVLSLFDVGVNRQFLKPHIRYQSVYTRMMRGNSKLMKLLTPQQLHKRYIKGHYDIEIAYLEGPCARVISGCTDPSTKRVAWIHTQQDTAKKAAASFRSVTEAVSCYSRFDKIVCVSEGVKTDFTAILPNEREPVVLYNTNETAQILAQSEDPLPSPLPQDTYNLIAVGKLVDNKGMDRLIRITSRLLADGISVHLNILGIGPEESKLKKLIAELGLVEKVTFHGYDTNPYRYVAKCDLFLCASHSEGFSTAASEALIVGTPVCTVEVAGMKEMLGGHNEYGIVTENDEDALYQGVKNLLEQPEQLAYYKRQAALRGKDFSKENTVKAVETMLVSLGDRL